MNRSFWNKITTPPDTYIDGYGTTRKVYEPKIVTLGRKVYNGIDKFMRPGAYAERTDPETGQIYIPNMASSSGIIELINPAGLVGKIDDVVALSKQLKRVATTYKRPAKIAEETAHLLKEHGLTKADTYRLLEDGWDLDQIFEAVGRHGLKTNGKPNSSGRAKLFNSEMLDVGMNPRNKSKFEYLDELQRAGEKIYKDKYGTPMTYDEWVRKHPGQDPSKSVISNDELYDYFNL